MYSATFELLAEAADANGRTIDAIGEFGDELVIMTFFADADRYEVWTIPIGGDSPLYTFSEWQHHGIFTMGEKHLAVDRWCEMTGV